MSSPRFQVRLQVYNFDKTKLHTTTRAKIYADVAVANSAAEDWLKNLLGEDEVVQIISEKEDGMRVFAVRNLLKTEDVISAWAETVRVKEEKEEKPKGGASADGAEK